MHTAKRLTPQCIARTIPFRRALPCAVAPEARTCMRPCKRRQKRPIALQSFGVTLRRTETVIYIYMYTHTHTHGVTLRH